MIMLDESKLWWNRETKMPRLSLLHDAAIANFDGGKT
jgi:hypothetical protein